MLSKHANMRISGILLCQPSMQPQRCISCIEYHAEYLQSLWGNRPAEKFSEAVRLSRRCWVSFETIELKVYFLCRYYSGLNLLVQDIIPSNSNPSLV